MSPGSQEATEPEGSYASTLKRGGGGIASIPSKQHLHIRANTRSFDFESSIEGVGQVAHRSDDQSMLVMGIRIGQASET